MPPDRNNIIKGSIRVIDQLGRDEYEDARISIDLPHHMIHEGKHYMCMKNKTGTSLSLSFKTPEDSEIHMLVLINTASSAHLEIKEEVTITATSGTQISLFNRNRNSSNTSGLLENKSGTFVADEKLLQDATVSGGASIETFYVFGEGNPNNFPGNGKRSSNEIELLKDTEYQVLLTSDDGSQGLFILLDWYES